MQIVKKGENNSESSSTDGGSETKKPSVTYITHIQIQYKWITHTHISHMCISICKVWVRNIQLAMFSMGIAIPVLALSSDFDASDPWRGFTVWVVALGFNNSFGGLLVAVIVKYANNILKGFSTALSTILATLISIPLFGLVKF